jgi:hypothetical protein
MHKIRQRLNDPIVPLICYSVPPSPSPIPSNPIHVPRSLTPPTTLDADEFLSIAAQLDTSPPCMIHVVSSLHILSSPPHRHRHKKKRKRRMDFYCKYFRPPSSPKIFKLRWRQLWSLISTVIEVPALSTLGTPCSRSIAHTYFSVEYTGARPTVLAPKAIPNFIGPNSPNAQTVWRYAQKFSLSLAPKKMEKSLTALAGGGVVEDLRFLRFWAYRRTVWAFGLFGTIL